MKIHTIVAVVMAIGSLASCDPGQHGDLRVYNQSDTTLTVMTIDRHAVKGKDTVTYTIAPGGNEVIYVLGGLGNNRTLECCPCYLDSILVFAGAHNIKKDPNDTDGWVITNKSKLRRFGGPDVKCEFYVQRSDIR